MEHLLKKYSKLLNTLLSNKFDWFKKIELKEIKHGGVRGQKNFINPVGKIYVDSNWGYKQWKEYHYDTPFPADEEINFGDIIGGDLSLEIQDEFKVFFSSITTQPLPKYMSFSWLDVVFVDDEKIEESIRRILKQEILKESKKDNKITCDNCGWSWKLSEGGDDPYTCHKCWNTKSELTEKCWPGYTQKGMKTMFGKRYPNCVKKTLKEWYITRDREKELGISYNKLENIINTQMFKKHDWWKGLNIEDTIFSEINNIISIYGVLNVDRMWAKQQLKKLRPYFKTKNGEGVEIDDIIDSEVRKEISNYLTMILSTLTKHNQTEGVRLGALHIKFV